MFILIFGDFLHEPFALFRSAERAEPNAVDLEEAGEVVLTILLPLISINQMSSPRFSQL